jgi:hypothetical protein
MRGRLTYHPTGGSLTRFTREAASPWRDGAVSTPRTPAHSRSRPLIRELQVMNRTSRAGRASFRSEVNRACGSPRASRRSLKAGESRHGGAAGGHGQMRVPFHSPELSARSAARSPRREHVRPSLEDRSSRPGFCVADIPQSGDRTKPLGRRAVSAPRADDLIVTTATLPRIGGAAPTGASSQRSTTKAARSISPRASSKC